MEIEEFRAELKDLRQKLNLKYHLEENNTKNEKY